MAAPTYVIGHRNPDSDSICSAIAYADYKNRRGDASCVPARCGNSNARIDAILGRFAQPLPIYLSDVTPRVRDIMTANVVKVGPKSTCAEALELIDQHDVRTLPVVEPDNRLVGTLSIFQLGGFFLPHMKEVRQMRRVQGSLAAIARSLKARVLHLRDADSVEELYVRIGAMDIRSFGRYTQSDNIPWEQTIIIVGDRWDIQQKSIQNGVRLLVISGGLPIDDEVVNLAREKGVSLLVSPLDSATTSWVIRAASSIEALVDRKTATFDPDTRLTEARRKVAALAGAAYPVVDDDQHLLGIFSKTDLIKPVQTRLILVDHNELTQAVPGAAEVEIAEIIDHHRLGAPATNQPIRFINEPVGSTCTIVANLYRRDNLKPTAEIAGLLMSGLISDTLHLNSPTTTEQDYDTLSWLAPIAGIKSAALADLIFSSGSIILAQSPEKVIAADNKIYDEEGLRFSVSQVEELGFGNFRAHADALADALDQVRRSENLFFSCLFVTDINTQNSLLLVKGDHEFIARISYPHADREDTFDLQGIVSRKKQLIPYLTSALHGARHDGALPSKA
ncbi:MAG: putative manganese-dependent inorganic diphosphatase [Opitutaceae bacterium]